MLQLILRAFCALTRGHAWHGFYTRDYSGREVLAETCAHCGTTRRTLTGRE